MYRITTCSLATALLLATFFACSAMSQEFKYPVAKKSDHIDEYFGVFVPDPYNWLEEDVRNSDEVRQWVTAENKITFDYLKQLPNRDQIENRLTELWNYEKFSAPFKIADQYYFFKNNGLQNQNVLFSKQSLDAESTMVIDPNTWSEDGTIALGGLAFSDDGKYIAYGIQDGGSDWRTWRVMDASGKLLDDKLEWLKFTSASWDHESQGFYYSRFPKPQEGEAFQSTNLNNKVYYHKVGTPQSEDTLVYEDPQNPDWGFGAEVTEDGRYLIITVSKGTDAKYRIYYKPLQGEQSEFTTLIDNFENEYSFIGNKNAVFYFKTDRNTPNGSVIAIDTANRDEEHWTTILPEAEESLSSVGWVNDMLVAHYLKDAKTQIKIHNLDGSFVRNVDFPGIGTANGFGGKQNYRETFYTFSSFATPPSIYRYDMVTGESKLLRQAKVDFDSDDYEIKQVFYNSKDGTRVPMFIAHKKGLELTGDNPTLLYGYGGFNISLTPGFSVSRLQWMEMGGVFAMANLRGGGEYGEKWHKAGTKTQKQNVFDDFIGAAQWLIENEYTSSKHLGIQGGSNGGLLVGACMAQRPDLFAACLPAVGVMDMLKFQNWTAGRYWVDDYGSSAASKDEFDALLAYSPYHNLADGTEYPPTLVTTADTDDRVVPGHSFKFAARLQEAHAGDAPVLIRIETRAGHGSGKPTAMIIEEYADVWAFLAKHTGLNPQFPSAAKINPEK